MSKSDTSLSPKKASINKGLSIEEKFCDNFAVPRLCVGC